MVSSFLFSFFLVICTRSIYIGIDVGSYFTKASTVTSNEHPVIATNYETKRMTHTFIAFRPPPNFDVENLSDVSPQEAQTLFPEFGQNAFNLMMNRPWLGTGFLPYFIDINNDVSKELADNLFVNNLNSSLYNKTQKERINNNNNNSNNMDNNESFADINGDFIGLRASRVPFSDCVPLFYKYFVNAVTKGRPIHGLNLVVPAYFTIPQRNQLRRFFRIAQLRNVRIIDDVEAVSYVYSNDKTNKFKDTPRIVLFIDLGATSIKAYAVFFSIEAENPNLVNADRLSYEYDAEQGGAFLTTKIVNYMAEKLGVKEPTDSEKWRMFDSAEKLKKQLTLTENAKVTIENIAGKDRSFTMNRDELQELSKDFIKSFLNIVQKASFNLTIDECEIIGGSSRLPFIQQVLINASSELKLERTLNADDTIAIGAGYFCQFIREVSRYTPVYLNDFASPVNITLLTINGSVIVCHQNRRCAARMFVDGGARYAIFVYGNETLRRGTKTQSFGYSVKHQDQDIELLFVHSPFDLHSARTHVVVKSETETTSTTTTTTTSKSSTSTTKMSSDETETKEKTTKVNVNVEPIEKKRPLSPIFKAIVKSDKNRKLKANAHNRLELLVQQIENEIEHNESVINHTSEEQRNELKLATEHAKKWIFENADIATDPKNFTKLADNLNRLTLPIYKRIKEGKALAENAKLYVETLQIAKYALEKDWPSKSVVSTEKLEEFRKLFNWTEEWFINASEANHKVSTSELPPFKSKDFRKHGMKLYDEFLKIEKIANPTLAPTPKADSSKRVEKDINPKAQQDKTSASSTKQTKATESNDEKKQQKTTKDSKDTKEDSNADTKEKTPPQPSKAPKSAFFDLFSKSIFKKNEEKEL